MSEEFKTIAVIGTGLIGASFSGAYRKAYPEAIIYGIDVSEDSLTEGKERGWLTEGFLPTSESIASIINSCELVMISTPVPATASYFQLLADVDYKGIISDACSTKELIVEQAQEILPYPNNYIPGHPMSGSEKSGIEGSRDDLFEGCHWVLCPDENSSPEAYARLHEVLASLGARVVSLSRENHDEAVAVVSHVPHFVASSLVELAVRHAGDQESIFRLAAGGFKDSTRIAAGSPTLWTGIAFDNQEAIVSGLEEIRGILGEFSTALAQGNAEEFKHLLQVAADARRSLPAKWIPATEDLLEVRIPMANRKGVVAEVTTIASQVGCNIQSIEIDHVTSSTANLILILTDEGDVGKFSTQLIKAGFSISFKPLNVKED